MVNIALYGQCDKRIIVFGLFKLLQDFGSVAFITQERHYRRLIDSYEYGYFQDVFICSTDETPDTVFTALHKNPGSFDFIIWDTNDMVPDDVDITFVCSCFRDEFIFDEILDLYPEQVYVKFMYDSKKENNCHNVPISTKLFKYVELTEAYKVLEPFNFPEVSKIFEEKLAPILEVQPKAVKGILRKEWKE